MALLLEQLRNLDYKRIRCPWKFGIFFSNKEAINKYLFNGFFQFLLLLLLHIIRIFTQECTKGEGLVRHHHLTQTAPWGKCENMQQQMMQSTQVFNVFLFNSIIIIILSKFLLQKTDIDFFNTYFWHWTDIVLRFISINSTFYKSVQDGVEKFSVSFWGSRPSQKFFIILSYRGWTK